MINWNTVAHEMERDGRAMAEARYQEAEHYRLATSTATRRAGLSGLEASRRGVAAVISAVRARLRIVRAEA